MNKRDMMRNSYLVTKNETASVIDEITEEMDRAVDEKKQEIEKAVVKAEEESSSIPEETGKKEVPAAKAKKAVKEAAPEKKAREPEEKICAYLSTELIRKLRIENVEREKEKSRSDIIRAGVEIVLAMDSRAYSAIKTMAVLEGKPAADLIASAVEEYVKNHRKK